MTKTSEITIIAETTVGMTEQISVSVVKDTDEVRFTDVKILPVPETIVKPRPLPILPVEPTDPEVITIIPVIEEQQNQIIGTGCVIK